jgi:L-threonylcarbamoyladenylate synthase
MTNSRFNFTCSAADIQEAAEKLRAGHLVAFPTETVYGLGADASNAFAVERIYEVKGRPTNHPLIVHVASISGLEIWARNIPNYATKLAHAYWPGPLTLILERTDTAKDFITGGQEFIGIRVPRHPAALELLRRFELLGGLGVAAPSANQFGRVSPTSADHVRLELGPKLREEDLILDGGPSQIGIESTIVDCTSESPKILRPGYISQEMISFLAVGKSINHSDTEIRTSGMVKKHYAPRAKVSLDQRPLPGQGLIANYEHATPTGVIRLMSPRNDTEFAAELYSALRTADEMGLEVVCIFQPSGDGLSSAIRDRLQKASSS